MDYFHRPEEMQLPCRKFQKSVRGPEKGAWEEFSEPFRFLAIVFRPGKLWFIANQNGKTATTPPA
jgi:hypothetical protein